MNSTKKSYDLRELWKRIRIAWRDNYGCLIVLCLLACIFPGGYGIYRMVSFFNHHPGSWWFFGISMVIALPVLCFLLTYKSRPSNRK